MSESSKAVFLSYASQDAEAAKRIADALRGAGVEVWFDAEGGLEHGDEWDAKIRRQIKECVLFIPIISANTQAREEGYFRLEWELAAQRALSIASGVPFILPVVIDETKEGGALVPDRFRAVQWTRLPDGEVRAEVLQRFLKLWSHRTGVLKEQAAQAAFAAPSVRDPGPVRSPTMRVAWFAAIALLIGSAGWWWLRRLETLSKPSEALASISIATQPSAPRGEQSGEGDGDFALLESICEKYGDATHEELALAQELGGQLVARYPRNAHAWAAYALATLGLVEFESDDAKYPAALSQAQRAVSLEPNGIEPRYALGKVFLRRSTTRADGISLLRNLADERPQDARVALALAKGLGDAGQSAAALDALARLGARGEKDAYAWYLRSGILMEMGRLAEAKAAVDKSIALHAGPRALMQRGYIQVFLEDDYAAAAETINNIPGQFLIRESETWAYGWFWLNHRKPDKSLARWRAFDGDFVWSSPKGYYVGRALEMAGEPDAARFEWQAALRKVEAKIATEPDSRNLLGWKAMLAACLGEAEVSAQALAVYRTLEVGATNSYFVPLILARLGRNDEAITELISRWGKISAGSARFARTVILHEALFDPLRGDARFQAFVQQIRDDPRFPIPRRIETAVESATGREKSVDDKSVAVLAFANLSDDKANEYFSDGISEELLNVLAKVPGLKVAARTSAFFFKGKEVPIQEIAKQLGVAYVVEGSVRKAGDKVRITAQLIKAADGFHVWSDTFTRDLKDIFAVQDEIAGLIARNLQLKLRLAPENAQVSPEAFALFLQGRFLARQESNPARKQSIDFYRRALQLEPRYALAWAEMAQSYVRLARFGGMPTAEGMSEARAAAQRALAIDADQPVALDALGWVQRTADWDWRAAQKSFDRAVSLAPEDAAILTGASIVYFNVGRTEESLALARKAVDRDPLNAMAQINYGDLLINCGRLEAGVTIMRQGLALAPGAEEFSSHLAIALEQMKRSAEADAAIEREPSESYRLWGRGMIAALRDDPPGIARAREALMARNDPTMDGYIAMLYGAEKNRDQAFAWMERTFRERDSTVCWLRANVVFYRNFLGDPRWTEFVRRAGLAEDQLK